MWQNDRELLDDFVAETLEHVSAIERELLDLEKRPEGKPTVDAIFRAAHSVKGNAGLFGFDSVMNVAHAMETVLGRMRSGELHTEHTVVSALLVANERLGAMMGDLEQAASVETNDVLSTLHSFRGCAATRGSEARFTLGPPASLKSTAPPATVRVPVSRLDELLVVTHELSLLRRTLLGQALKGDLDAVVQLAEQLDTLGDRLEQRIGALRVLPLSTVFGKCRRVVRGLSIVLRKELDLEIVGEELEVEKSVLEALADPVGHLLRNAADHGIEDAETRRAAGKPERGLIQIRASLDGLGLLVEISDDGRGIDPQRVARSAVARGLVDERLLAGISDEQLMALVFEPGFSTAAEVTDVSGRGVGLDVVRESVHRVGGSIDVRSAVGVGTTISLRLPAHI